MRTHPQQFEFCNSCATVVLQPPPPPPFYVRWWRTICYYYHLVTSDYIIVKVYTKDIEAPVGFNGKSELIHKEITDSDYYNVPDNRFYGTKAHATPIGFIWAAILCKRAKKENTDPNIEYWLDPVYYLPQPKNTIMKNFLYIIALVLIIIWAIGFLGYHVGGLVHILLVIALISILLRIIQGSEH